MQITHKVELDVLKIYFDNVLHLSVYLEDCVGMNSWIESTSFFQIEFVFRKRAKMSVKYADIKVWKDVLSIINDYI